MDLLTALSAANFLILPPGPGFRKASVTYPTDLIDHLSAKPSIAPPRSRKSSAVQRLPADTVRTA